MKRTLLFENPAYLKLENAQLKVIHVIDKVEIGSIPIEDIGLIMVDNPRITITSALIQELMANNVTLVQCDAAHQPLGFMLPFYGHTESTARVKQQTEISEPLKKQLWKQTVISKIKNQAEVLKQRNIDPTTLLNYANQVQSGDSTNMEGIAAQHYWRNLISPSFKRERYGDQPNSFFNYGYAILRATQARTIVDTGLLPIFGIFHKNKYNPYPLADDLMEPYRPVVDSLIMNWLDSNWHQKEVDGTFKYYILKMLNHDINIENKTRPMSEAIKQSTVSFYQCISGKKKKLELPKLYENSTL